MDGHVFTYIFGTTSIFIGTGIIYRLFRPKRQSGIKWINNKAIVIPLGLIIIGNGLYDILNSNSGRYDIGSNHWTANNKKIMVETCLRDASTTADKYPEIMKTYCECSTEKITEKQKYSEYIDNLKKPQDEQLKIIMPIIKDCYDIMRTQIAIKNSE
jgi:hypothetical protein